MTPTQQSFRRQLRTAVNDEGVEGGLFLIVAVAPLAFLPFSTAPFADVKLLFVLLGTALTVATTIHAPARVLAATAVWLSVAAAATALGVDVWWSIQGLENQSTGFLLLLACGVLLIVGTSVSTSTAARLPAWIVASGTIAAGVALIQRYAVIPLDPLDTDLIGSTLGQPVVLGGFLASAAVAAVHLRRKALTPVALFLLGSAMAVSGNRSAWIAAFVGIVVVVFASRSRIGHRKALLVPLVAALVLWTAVDVITAPEVPVAPTQRFAEVGEGTSVNARIHVWRAVTRGWASRPTLGWGPGTTWAAYLSSATENDVRSAAVAGASGRGWGDAHNLILELGVTTGVLGLLPFLALVATLIPAIARTARSCAWPLGVTLALVVVHAFQPMNVLLTPLMFLTAGLSARCDTLRRARLPSRLVRGSVMIAIALVTLRAVSGVLGHYGHIYASQPLQRAASALDPAGVAPSQDIGRSLAIDWRSGRRGADQEARRAVFASVAAHPWHPGARLIAADVLVLVDDLDGARAMLNKHLDRFSNDPVALAGMAALALRQGSPSEAQMLAERALRIWPDDAHARRINEMAQRAMDAERRSYD